MPGLRWEWLTVMMDGLAKFWEQGHVAENYRYQPGSAVTESGADAQLPIYYLAKTNEVQGNNPAKTNIYQINDSQQAVIKI